MKKNHQGQLKQERRAEYFALSSRFVAGKTGIWRKAAVFIALMGLISGQVIAVAGPDKPQQDTVPVEAQADEEIADEDKADPEDGEEKTSIIIAWQRMVDKKMPICTLMAKSMEQYRIKTYGYCGVPLPKGDPDFTLPKWKPLNTREYLDILEKVVIRGSALRGRSFSNGYKLLNEKKFLTIKDYADFAYNGVVSKALRQKYWGEFKADILKQIDKIELYSTEVDIDLDGQTEILYRMTPVYIISGIIYKKKTTTTGIVIKGRTTSNRLDIGHRRPGANSDSAYDKSQACRNIGLPGKQKAYFLYIPFDTWKKLNVKHSNKLERQELFFWRGQPVFWTDFGWHLSYHYRPNLALKSNLKNLCTFNYRH